MDLVLLAAFSFGGVLGALVCVAVTWRDDVVLRNVFIAVAVALACVVIGSLAYANPTVPPVHDTPARTPSQEIEHE